ncbi:hypothetical protein [Evansella tamaricis]|uniref:Glycine zipper domain-containing protein n=1 Tax=Evansella tamaricis TaxID=2069301 RepID=A0ABS6JHU2_9BACI|nr:hypothetical protein [Evansella tamaricis]MBU9713203.1 hypothetical protein [Evansella tamaricis]
MEMANVVDFVKEKKGPVLDFGVRTTSVTVGTASGGAVGGVSGAAIGAGIGMVVGGPVGAGLGYGIGVMVGAGSGLAFGAMGGNKVGKIISNSLKEEK